MVKNLKFDPWYLAGKLALCREERQRIMDEEKGKPPSKSKPVVVKSKKGALIPGKLQTRKAKLGRKVLSKSGSFT